MPPGCAMLLWVVNKKMRRLSCVAFDPLAISVNEGPGSEELGS